MNSTPTRIENDLFEAARTAGARSSRSAAQQIDHWARIGRALEDSPALNQRAIDRVLAGDGSYDELAEREQAVVRKLWDERITMDLASANFEVEFVAEGREWADADKDGNLVHRGTDSGKP